MEKELQEARQHAKEAEARLKEASAQSEDADMQVKEELERDPWDAWLATEPAPSDGHVAAFLRKALQEAQQEISKLRSQRLEELPSETSQQQAQGEGTLHINGARTPNKKLKMIDASTPLGKSQAPARMPPVPTRHGHGHGPVTTMMDPYMVAAMGPANPYVAS